MRLIGLRRIVVAGLAITCSLGAAPATPSYHVVERTVQKIRGDWAKPGAPAQPNAAGWNALFDATLQNLQAYGSASSENERLVTLNRLYQISNGLAAVSWPPAGELRESLREWLRPRVRLAWAGRRLVDRVNTLPAPPSPAVVENRQKWVRFVDNDLGQALKIYDSAATVAQRQNALRDVYAALDALRSRNTTSPWAPSIELQGAMNDLFNQPNFDVSVDKPTLYPVFAANLVTSGPVFRKGYWSQVTAGPWLGFGLLPSDDGIAFYNQQQLTSVTPITDFQRQVENNPQGKRAAKMYQFNAVQSDNAVLTITVLLRPSGISIYPSYNHNVNADISTTPQQRGGMARAIASLVGFNQPRITQMAYDNAIGQIRSQVVVEAQEEATERTQKEAAQRNATLAQYLVGGDRLAFRNILIEGLSLRSRPENALIGGTIRHATADSQVGASSPQPPELFRPESGVSADVHLSSVASNLARGFLQSDAAKQVENLMVVTSKIPPGAPPSEGVKVTRNVDYPTFLQAVQTAQAANDPKSVAIRVKRPTQPPDFGVDANGNLVALISDFQIDVPVPPDLAKGGGGRAIPPAKVFRIVAKQAEFAIGFKVEPQPDGGLRVNGKIDGFDPGPGARVLAINEDEAQATPLNAFASIFVLGGLRTKLAGQPIDAPIKNPQLQGFAIRSVSPLDPSGWIRVNLERVANAPVAAAPAADVAVPAPSGTATATGNPATPVPVAAPTAAAAVPSPATNPAPASAPATPPTPSPTPPAPPAVPAVPAPPATPGR